MKQGSKIAMAAGATLIGSWASSADTYKLIAFLPYLPSKRWVKQSPPAPNRAIARR